VPQVLAHRAAYLNRLFSPKGWHAPEWKSVSKVFQKDTTASKMPVTF
jgi:hypothetical protein